MRTANGLLGASFLLLLAITVTAGAAELPVTLTVAETGGVARPDWPVTSGVPLPEGAVRDVGELVLKDADGNPVPCQMDEAVRWPGGSLKWVHLTFFADLTADGQAEFVLDKGRPAGIDRPLVVSDDEDAVVIDTGAVKIAISRTRGTIVDSLERDGEQALVGQGLSLNGRSFVSRITRRTYNHSEHTNLPIATPIATSKCGTETWTLRPVDADHAELVGSETGPDGKCPREIDGHWVSDSGKIILRPHGLWRRWGFGEIGEDTYWTFETRGDQRGRTFSTLHGKIEKVEVEKSGPLMARIYLQGTFSAEDGAPFVEVGQDRHGQPYDDPSGDFFKYRTRIYAYAGRPYVYVVPAVTHLGPHDGTRSAYFQHLRMDFEAPRIADDTPVKLAGTEGTVGEGARLLQLLGVTPLTESRRERDLSYTVTIGGEEKARGERAIGSCLLGDDQAALGVAVRRFWEYGPKGITAAPDRVSLELWPDVDEFDGFLLGAGRQRSHEILLSASPDAEKELAAFLAPRLVARAPAAWYADCGAFGMLAEERDYAQGYPESQREALDRYEILMRSMVNPERAVRRGGSPGSVLNQFVPGWNDYGDLPWAKGWSNLHYDWTMNMVLHFLRTGKPEFFTAADAMAWHRKDIAQNHSGQCGRTSPHARWSNYLTYYENDNHRTPGGHQRPRPSHSWNRGIGYWYLLTGDPMARLVAVQSAEGLRGFYSSLIEGTRTHGNPRAELRMYGWSIENFLGAYEVTGDQKYLDWALGMFRSTFQDMYEHRRIEEAERMSPLMYGYSFSPICRLHHYTNDEKVLETLRYMVDEALLNRFVKFGTETEDGDYLFTATPYRWTREAWKNGTLEYRNPPWNFFWGNPTAYLYMQTGEQKYLDAARQFFRDAMFYYSARYEPKAPEYRCNLAYLDGMFNRSATKVHGWSGRFNLIYLFMEKQLSRGARFPVE